MLRFSVEIGITKLSPAVALDTGTPSIETEMVRFSVGIVTPKRRLKPSHLYTDMLARDGLVMEMIGIVFALSSSSMLGSVGVSVEADSQFVIEELSEYQPGTQLFVYLCP